MIAITFYYRSIFQVFYQMLKKRQTAFDNLLDVTKNQSVIMFDNCNVHKIKKKRIERQEKNRVVKNLWD